MNKVLKIGLIGFLLLGLVLIRFYEHELFSDPLLEFYTSEFSYAQAPEFDVMQVLGSTSLRYLLNSMISIAIIGMVFPYRKTILFSMVFYALVYLILTLLFWFFINDMDFLHQAFFNSTYICIGFVASLLLSKVYC